MIVRIVVIFLIAPLYLSLIFVLMVILLMGAVLRFFPVVILAQVNLGAFGPTVLLLVFSLFLALLSLLTSSLFLISF